MNLHNYKYHYEARMVSYWITLLVVIGSGINEVTGQLGGYCEDINCPCCASAPDGSRERSEICYYQDNCTYGCLDGYYGGTCYSECPAYCSRCAREFGTQVSRYYKICYLCADGFYNSTGVTDCSTPCPVNCVNNRCHKTTGHCLDGCTSDGWAGDKCNQCVSKFYDTECVPCPGNCNDDMCDANDGRCTNGCKDPKFTGAKCDQCTNGKYGDNCDELCPVNCHNGVCDINDTCSDGCAGFYFGSKCDRCRYHFYGDRCNIKCNGCRGGLCDRNTGICKYCYFGRYGRYCNDSCSSGCNNGGCGRYNATCNKGCRYGYSGDKCCVRNNNCELCDTVSTCSKCKSGFCGQTCTSAYWTGNKCECANGYYGTNCNPCPNYCKDGICHMSNGSCTNGCIMSQFTGDQCDQCQLGKHGENCDETCPANCKYDKCVRIDGSCASGCTGNFVGDKCGDCKPGYYGEHCDEVCKNCLLGLCDKTTGDCGYCDNGNYGHNCNLTCSSGCKNDVCYRYNANCTFGCRIGNSGDKCCVNNNNCELCDTVTICQKCKSGFYGNACGQTCPDKCAEGCNTLSGDCTACKTGYHGNKCTEPCPNKCQNSECSQQSGKCTACNIGYYGDACNKTCPIACRNKICYQDGGECGDCMVGYHGASCDLDCTTYCINETCMQETGACMYGCVEEYIDKCSQNNVVANDNIGTILGGVVGGLCVVIIILVGCFIHSRRRSRGTKENNEQETNNGVELEEQHDYEGLDEELKSEKTVYSDLQSDG